MNHRNAKIQAEIQYNTNINLVIAANISVVCYIFSSHFSMFKLILKNYLSKSEWKVHTLSWPANK